MTGAQRTFRTWFIAMSDDDAAIQQGEDVVVGESAGYALEVDLENLLGDSSLDPTDGYTILFTTESISWEE